jgi:Acyltransferase family
MPSLHNLSESSQLIQASSRAEQNLRFAGFDYLRAIFSIAIVADHTGLFILATLFGSSTLTDVLYANVSYIAVPVFFQISLFLFYLKSEKTGLQYFVQKRIPKLVYLYLFWMTFKILCEILVKGESASIKMATVSIRGFLEAIVSGGNSPFYFFFSLLFITTLAGFNAFMFRAQEDSSINIKVNYFLFFIFCILILSFSAMSSIIDDFPNHITFLSALFSIVQWNYNPLNFLPYIFTAAIVFHEFKEEKLKRLTPQCKSKLGVLMSLFLIFTMLEWNTLDDLTTYSRLSLVFGSWLLLYLALLSTSKPAAIVTFVSSCSLGIYAFHILFTHVLFSDERNALSSLAHFFPGLDILTEFCIALVGSIALTLLFRRTKGLKLFV